MKQAGATFENISGSILFLKQKGTENKIAVLSKLLSILPWSNFPLKINWVDSQMKSESILSSLPPHIRVTRHSLEELSADLNKFNKGSNDFDGYYQFPHNSPSAIPDIFERTIFRRGHRESDSFLSKGKREMCKFEKCKMCLLREK